MYLYVHTCLYCVSKNVCLYALMHACMHVRMYAHAAIMCMYPYKRLNQL